MKIQYEAEMVTITCTDSENISFHLSNVKELSNALMIVRQLQEHDQLHSVCIEYGGSPSDPRQRKLAS